MRKIIQLFVMSMGVVSVAFGSVIEAGPIPVNGGGSAYFSLDEGGLTAQFSGTDGTDSVDVSGGETLDYSIFGEQYIGSGVGQFYGSDGSDTECIRDVCSQYVSFDVGGGGGSLNLYDSTGDLLAQATLVGWVTITSIGPIPGGSSVTPYEFEETFVISSTPEPGTAWLSLLGAVAAICQTRAFGPVQRRFS